MRPTKGPIAEPPVPPTRYRPTGSSELVAYVERIASGHRTLRETMLKPGESQFEEDSHLIKEDRKTICGTMGPVVGRWADATCRGCREGGRATARYAYVGSKQYVEYPLDCPDCGHPMKLKRSSGEKAEEFPVFYSCSSYPLCKGSHRAHSNGEPDGAPTSSATKQARRTLFDEMDSIRKDCDCSKNAVYNFIRSILGLEGKVYLAQLDRTQCDAVIQAMRNYRGNLSEFEPSSQRTSRPNDSESSRHQEFAEEWPDLEGDPSSGRPAHWDDY